MAEHESPACPGVSAVNHIFAISSYLLRTLRILLEENSGGSGFTQWRETMGEATHTIQLVIRSKGCVPMSGPASLFRYVLC